MTSSDAVVKVRGILRRATSEKQKVGHLGTLDPLAVGVLPIAVGNATRLFDSMQKKRKTYIATFKFSQTTDTLDRGGKIVKNDTVKVEKTQILEVIPKLLGEISQIPPQYSAKSVNGRRAYDLAREGETVLLQPKTVNIYSIKLLACSGETVSLPCNVFDEGNYQITNYGYALSDNEFAFEIECGSGTYIRAIARDMANYLGTVGYMTSLCRTSSGAFSLDGAVTFKKFEENPLAYVTSMQSFLIGYPQVELSEREGKKALNGVPVKCESDFDSTVAVSILGDTVALGEINDGYLRLTVRL